MTTNKKNRIGLKLLDALYAEDYGYASYVISGNPKLVNWKEPNGNSLLHVMCYSNMDKQIRLLLKHKADPNIKNMSGETPLIWATKLKSLKAINVLLNEGNGVRINDVDVSGSTVLHHAAHFGIPEVINILLDNGADVFIKDCDGMTAYDVVCEGNSPGHVSVAALIYQKVSMGAPIPMISVQSIPNSPTMASPGKFTRTDSYLAMETLLSKHASPLQLHPLLRGNHNKNQSISRPSTAVNISPFSPVAESSNKTLLKSASTPINSLTRSGSKLKRPVSAFGMSVDRSYSAGPLSRSPMKSTKTPVVLNPPDYHLPFIPNNARIRENVCNMTKEDASDIHSIEPTSKSSLTILLGVEQCHNCENHAWCVWHDEEKYVSNADESMLACICTLLNLPNLPLTVYGYRNKASKTRLGALEVCCSIFVPNEMNMGKFDPENEEVPNIYGSTFDKVNGGTWLHHLLHSKLKSKMWPNPSIIQENLLAVVRYLFSINGKRDATDSNELFKLLINKSDSGSKRSSTLVATNALSDAHMHMEEQYEKWWERTQPPDEPPETPKSVKVVEFVVAPAPDPITLDSARSKTSSISKKISGSHDGDVDVDPDEEGNDPSIDLSSKPSDIDNLPQTTGGTTSLLMQMANDMDRIKEEKKLKKAQIIPPYLIESIPKSSELDPLTNPFQITMKRKKEWNIDYEMKVLERFFVFDNSVPKQI